MKSFFIISVMAFSAPALLALNMSPRAATANAAAPARLTKTTTTTRTTTTTTAKSKSMLARVTVYWASGGRGSDRYTRRHKTATGTRLRSGHCAVDPRHIPYGSQVVLADGTKLAAVDTGSAVRTRRAARHAGRTRQEKNAIVVDRFFETKGQAMAWAKTHPMFMPVQVVTPKNQTGAASRKYVLASNRPTRAGALNKVRN